MSTATALYTPEVLGLATRLATWPLCDELILRGNARAAVCGSTLELGLATDADGQVATLGLKVHACAIGQAAAALFAESAAGRDRAAIAAALAGIEAWLGDSEVLMPGWPGLETIAAARAYPARHGAILLAWKAALAALP